ncbi:MAG: transcriptional repressor LexA [Actinobacteria bacterium]|nr:transcriptional repressor LexA [Actinomycetota bacterium]
MKKNASEKRNLSPRQKEVLDFIVSEIHRKGYPPSIREIGKFIGVKSSATAYSHLDILEKKGYVRKDPTKPRAIEIIGYRNTEFQHTSKQLRNIPLVGRIAAGQPVLAQENIEDTFPLPADFVKDENSFMLEVKGLSMKDAGILPGDFVIVKQQNNADEGDIIVALLEDEATLKRFFREADGIRLQPENSAMKPIITKDVKIIGKVIGLLRKI